MTEVARVLEGRERKLSGSDRKLKGWRWPYSPAHQQEKIWEEMLTVEVDIGETVSSAESQMSVEATGRKGRPEEWFST